MGCGSSKDAVATGSPSGSGRCNRFRRKSSRAPLPSDDVSAVPGKGSDEAIAERAATLTNKATEEEAERAIEEQMKQEGIISNKAGNIVKDNEEVITVAKDKEAPTVKGTGEKKGVEIKKDEAAIKDAKEVITVLKGEGTSTEKKAVAEIQEKKQEPAKKDEIVKDKEVIADQKDDAASTKNAIIKEKEEAIRNEAIYKSIEAAIKEKISEGDSREMTTIHEHDDAASTETDIEEDRENDSVTFPVSMVTDEDGSVRFGAPVTPAAVKDNVTLAAAPVIKDEDSATFAATAVAMEDGSVTSKPASTSKEDSSVIFSGPVGKATKDDDSVASTAAPVIKDNDIVAVAAVVPIASTTKGDDSVTSTAAPAIKDEDSATFAAAPVAAATKDEDSVTSTAAPTIKDDDSVIFKAVPVAKEDISVTSVVASTTDDSSVSSEPNQVTNEKDSVTFTAVTASKDSDIVTFAAALATKDNESITFPAVPATKDEAGVTLTAAPVTKDDNDSVTLVAAPVAKEEVTEQPEPSENHKEVKNGAEQPKPTVVEVVTEGDGAMEVKEEVAEQPSDPAKPKPSEDTEKEVKDEAALPQPTVVEEVVTKVDEKREVEGKVDAVEEIKVQQKEESASQEPEEKKSNDALREENGEKTIDPKDAVPAKEKGEGPAVSEKKNDEEQAGVPSESASN